MDSGDARRWFAAYLADFVALCRGDLDDMRRQVEGVRAAGYDRSDELLAETTLLNASCAVHRGRFAALIVH
jgi:hypothetical protein